MVGFGMNPARSANAASETSAQVILEVAKAISSHLELTDVLGALITSLKPTVAFDAVSVVVLDGDHAKLQSLYIDGFEHRSHETVQSLLERTVADKDIEPLEPRIPVSQHHMSVIMKDLRPYVCTDVEAQRRFVRDDDFLKRDIRSYISLPL